MNEAAVGNKSEVGLLRVDAGLDFDESGKEVGAGGFLIAEDEKGPGPADEPRGAKAGGAELFFDVGKDVFGLAGGEGGIDPVVTEYD